MSADTVFDAAAGQGRDWIAARIPHQGRMCLLDRVDRMSAAESVCSAISHTDADNPLREGGRLGAACGIEYAAQAMALHGALAAQARQVPAPTMGFLVSVRSVALHVARLDDVPGRLMVHAHSDADNGDHSVYTFAISAEDGRPLVDGRAVVMLDAAPLVSS